MSDSLIDFSRLVKGEPVKPVKKGDSKGINKTPVTGGSKITTKDVIHSLSLRFINHDFCINNAYIFDWESDFFSVSESGYLYEVEVKVSKSDFKDDFKKKNKHMLLESTNQKDFSKIPNKFFYAVPRGLLTTWSIPAYAGLIEVGNRNEAAVVVREAPFIHKEKLFDKYHLKLTQKFYWRYKDMLYRAFPDQDVEFEDKK